MCRTCFSVHERYSKLYDAIQENLRKEAGVLQIFPSSSMAQPFPNRHRLRSSFSQQVHVGQSPEVEVHVCQPCILEWCVVNHNWLILLQVHACYKTPKTFVLTPSQKHTGRQLLEKASCCCWSLKKTSQKKYIFKMVWNESAKEVRNMASDSDYSILQRHNPDHLKVFTWDMLLSELPRFVLLLKSVLSSATNTRVHPSSTDAAIGMCAAILIKHCNSKMKLVQKFIFWFYTLVTAQSRNNSVLVGHTLYCDTGNLVSAVWVQQEDNVLTGDTPVLVIYM